METIKESGVCGGWDAGGAGRWSTEGGSLGAVRLLRGAAAVNTCQQAFVQSQGMHSSRGTLAHTADCGWL